MVLSRLRLSASLSLASFSGVDGHELIGFVAEIQVEVVGLQPPQAGVAGFDDVFP